MNKTRKIITFYLFIIAFSLIVESCCTNENRIIGKGLISAWDLATQLQIEDNIVTGPFSLRSNYEVEVVTGQLQNASFINTAYGTTCDEVMLNQLQSDQIEIRSDKDFVFMNNTVPANTNFIALDSLEYHADALLGLAFSEIAFTENFINNVEFENENYTFTVKIPTTDGLTLENSITLFMDLD